MGEAHTWTAKICGKDLVYRSNLQQLSFDNTDINVKRREKVMYLRLIVDRTSLEVFVHEGDVAMSFCFLPEAANHVLEFHADGGNIYLRNLNIHTLRSTWV